MRDVEYEGSDEGILGLVPVWAVRKVKWGLKGLSEVEKEYWKKF